MDDSPMFNDINLNRGPLHEQIADEIQKMITTKRIQPGEKLPAERSLATILGVSRPTVREAMRLMQHRGLVTRKQGGGTYLIQMSSEAVAESLARYFWIKECTYEDLMQVRRVLEPEAAALAAESATPEDIEFLEAKLNDLDQGFDTGDPHKLASSDSEFHMAIAETSGNDLLSAIVAGIDHLVRRSNQLNSAEIFDKPTKDSHRPISQAIKNGNPEQAREAALAHIRLSRDVFQRTSLKRKADQLNVSGPADESDAGRNRHLG